MRKGAAKSHITQLWKGASVAIAATASSGATFYIDENAQIDLFLARREFPWKWHLWASLLLVPIQHVFRAKGWGPAFGRQSCRSWQRGDRESTSESHQTSSCGTGGQERKTRNKQTHPNLGQVQCPTCLYRFGGITRLKVNPLPCGYFFCLLCGRAGHRNC